MKIHINKIKDANESGNGTVAVMEESAHDAVTVTRAQTRDAVTTQSAVPITLLAAGGLTPAEFWENIKQAAHLAHLDPWEIMLFGLIMECSYLYSKKSEYFSDTPLEGKIVGSGIFAVAVLTIANGIDPNPDGLTIWGIIIGICVILGYVTRKYLLKTLKGKPKAEKLERMVAEEMRKLEAEETRGGHARNAIREQLSGSASGAPCNNEAERPEENRSKPAPDLYPCSNCRTDSGEPKFTKGKRYCMDCLTPRAANKPDIGDL